jgi:hypothetical protein
VGAGAGVGLGVGAAIVTWFRSLDVEERVFLGCVECRGKDKEDDEGLDRLGLSDCSGTVSSDTWGVGGIRGLSASNCSRAVGSATWGAVGMLEACVFPLASWSSASKALRLRLIRLGPDLLGWIDGYARLA